MVLASGEWEIGDKPYRTSGEEYNLVLNIQVTGGI